VRDQRHANLQRDLRPGLRRPGGRGLPDDPLLLVSPSIGLAFGIRSFITVVLGGIGSIPGCILGGLILGVVESVAAQFRHGHVGSIFSFVIFILVLSFRPTGLMGMKV